MLLSECPVGSALPTPAGPDLHTVFGRGYGIDTELVYEHMQVR